MPPPLKGLHHITATVDDAQDDLDCYVKALGLRLVKKTVNFDNHAVYHFYYGNAEGTPGTLMTTFPYKGHGVRVGTHGAGQITATGFSIPADALDFWRRRLAAHGLKVTQDVMRFGDTVLTFSDPSGLVIELIGTQADERMPWVPAAGPRSHGGGSGDDAGDGASGDTASGDTASRHAASGHAASRHAASGHAASADSIDASSAIRGIYAPTLSIRNAKASIRFLTEILGWEVAGTAGARTRLFVNGDVPGHRIDILHTPDAPDAVNGLGTVHHVAMGINSDAEQLALRAELVEHGVNVTPVRDRQYFHSIYFREPGGVLYEVATIPPGFTIDEDLDALGRGLKLPKWEEKNRAEIEAGLDDVSY